jgi:CRISPR-associated protein Cmr1
MEIKLRTLTPLWTGGVEGTCDRVHETGIIGSLRWWYEAIVRGMEGNACDPTSDGRCQYDQKKGEETLCPACHLFGCTGWGRRFRLQLDTGRLAYPQQDKQDWRRFKPPGRRTGWFYGAGQLAAEDTGINGRLIVLRGDQKDVANEVLVTMQLAATWGGIGARTQHGYGVVKIQATRRGQPVQVDPEAFLVHHPVGATHDGPLPALTDFFFARFRPVVDAPDQWWTRTDANKRPLLGAYAATLEQWGGGSLGPVSIAPAVKNQLRYGSNAFATTWGNQRYIWGHIDRQRRKAKINISGAYLDDGQWTFRVWGWLPRDRRDFDRATFLNDLYMVLHSPTFWRDVFGASPLVGLTSIVWREFDSSRDTVTRIADAGAFLTSLLV